MTVAVASSKSKNITSAVDISAGFKFMTYSIKDHPEMGDIDALQAAANLNFDLKPVLFFLPENLHLIIDAGLSYNLGTKVEPKSNQYNGKPTYGGIGFNSGISLDYHLNDLPVAFRIFGTNTVVPQGIPFPDKKTGFINFGANLIIILKRHR